MKRAITDCSFFVADLIFCVRFRKKGGRNPYGIFLIMTNRTKKTRDFVESEKKLKNRAKIFKKGIDKSTFMW
ncbi:MAG: hypothetical protein J6A46_03830 [Clostridia bacterium]|nr:hypothetical protein [Clostridia bacterium]